MKKAIAYLRVSTEGQVKEGVSLENQEERIKAYCEYKSIKLIRIIKDEGISGGINKKREGFINILDIISQNEIDALIILSLERLSRDMLTLLSLEKYLNEYDVELHSIDGEIDTSTPDGFMSFAMKAFLGEMERRQVKHRTKSAMQHKKSKGEVVGSIPYGFQRQGDLLLQDINEQTIIKMANDLYGEGNRLVDIVAALKKNGKKTRAGKDWTPAQVRKLIKNYESKFKKAQTKIGQAARELILAVG